MKIYIGIDPGAKGALCALSETGLISFIDYTEETGELAKWLMPFIEHHKIEMISVEDVHSIFGASAKSNFNFGRNVGIIHGLIRGLNLPLNLVKPKEWQKEVGVKPALRTKPGETKVKRDIKKDVASIARRLYPGCDIYTPRGRLLDGRSDALMVAHYTKLRYK